MLIQNLLPQSIWVLVTVEKALICGGGEKMVEQRIRTRAIRPPHYLAPKSFHIIAKIVIDHEKNN